MLKDKVALVAGATRGAGRGIAIELGVAGAIVYCTGRSTKQQPSDMNGPERGRHRIPLNPYKNSPQ
jgi:NAD(P)-dependent dehydrogenase (short-subunit alcohol dehydrogenase family)